MTRQNKVTTMKYQMIDCDVLRSARAGDCTNGGVSSVLNRLALIVPAGVSGLYGPIELLGGARDMDVDALPHETLVLVRRVISGDPYYHAVPLGVERQGKMSSFGGNYITCCGNGFRTITGYPIAIHDRIED